MELKHEGDLLDRFEDLRVRFQKFKISATEANQLCQDVKIILPDITRLHQFHLGDKFVQLFKIMNCFKKAYNLMIDHVLIIRSNYELKKTMKNRGFYFFDCEF